MVPTFRILYVKGYTFYIFTRDVGLKSFNKSPIDFRWKFLQ